MNPANPQQAAAWLHQGMLEFINWFLTAKAGRKPVRWKLLLWDMAVTDCPEHDGYPDADWPAWRLYRHACGYVGQYEEISQRAVLRGFGTLRSVHTAISRYRDLFADYTKHNQGWRPLAAYLFSHRRAVIDAGERLPNCWQDFRALLEPAELWEPIIVNQLALSLRGRGRVLAVAHYPKPYAEFLPAVALGVRQGLSQQMPDLAVNFVSAWEDSLQEAVQDLNPAPDSLLIVPVHGAAAFTDLEAGLEQAAEQRVHLLVFCPDAATAARIEKAQMPANYDLFPIHLSPWYRPEAGQPQVGAVPPEVMTITGHSALLDALACFSALHRKPTLELLEAITGTDQNQIKAFLVEQASDWVAFETGTRRAFWAEQDGSVRYLEQRFDAEQLVSQYVTLIQRLAQQAPAGWAAAVLNLLKSMYQTGRLRLLRSVLTELGERGVAPQRIVEAHEPKQQFQARLGLARVYARAFLYEQAHELLLEAEPPPASDEFRDHQLCAAEILADQLADTGKTAFYEAASFIYEDLRRAATGALEQQLDELAAHLELAAGKPDKALGWVRRHSNPTLFGRAVEARALAELGRLDEALGLPRATGRPRGIELDRRPDEAQDQFEQRWDEHVRQLLGAPADETPVEALHQAAIRALERGHLAAAQQLIRHARSHYRDHVYLATAHARLLVEAGRAEEAVRFLFDLEDELTGRDNEVVEGALFDALLELFRHNQAAMLASWRERLGQLPQPIFDINFRREHYLPSQRARLVTQNAKAYWYGACGQLTHPRTNQVITELAQLDTPPALNLAARILAEHQRWNDALARLQRALALVQDPQTRIRTWNTQARILLDQAANGEPSALARADQALQVSKGLDRGNTYTMLLRAEWLERSGDSSRAAQVRKQAEALRRIEP
jgi:hypothetical protein